MATREREDDGGDPAENGKLKRKRYEKELRSLQAELCKLQDWVKHEGLRVIVVFEGRGTIQVGDAPATTHAHPDPRKP